MELLLSVVAIIIFIKTRRLIYIKKNKKLTIVTFVTAILLTLLVTHTEYNINGISKLYGGFPIKWYYQIIETNQLNPKLSLFSMIEFQNNNWMLFKLAINFIWIQYFFYYMSIMILKILNKTKIHVKQ